MNKVLVDNYEQIIVSSRMASVLLVSEYDWPGHIDRIGANSDAAAPARLLQRPLTMLVGAEDVNYDR